MPFSFIGISATKDKILESGSHCYPMTSIKTNHLCALLDVWQQQKDQLEWVLATIIETDGSSYRKPGAMMFINGLGQYFGLLSGGCLEADIMRQARKCWDSGENQIIQYDMRDEDDLSWKLGIGCGGMVKILLQPISETNNWLSLESLQAALTGNQTCYYQQNIDAKQPHNVCLSELPVWATKNNIGTEQAIRYFVSQQQPVIHLGIFGAGIDARPLAAMAKNLGWHVTLFDDRLGYAKASFFTEVDDIVRTPYGSLEGHPALAKFSAVVLMNHNVKLDALSLKLVQSSSAKYVGMLGPRHRTQRVFDEINLTPQQLLKPLHNPVGLDLGGELPESIALSMLSEIHAVLHSAPATTLTATQLAPCLNTISRAS